MSTKKVWFVTGASQGLGLTLAQELLKAGYRVAATSRKAAALREAVPASGHFLPLEVDLTNEESVKQAIGETVSHFGSIDVVVNNAGYGQLGAVEELTDEEVRRSFDVNVFGLLHVVRNAMPYLRAQQSGHIFNIASVGGYVGNFPGWSTYIATKFAVVGLSEALAEEVAPFGIRVSAVMPGYFRTNFLASGSLAQPAHVLDVYANVRENSAAHTAQINGNQPGDPVKAAAVFMAQAEAPGHVVHLFLGEDAYALAATQMKTVTTDMAEVAAMAAATAF